MLGRYTWFWLARSLFGSCGKGQQPFDRRSRVFSSRKRGFRAPLDDRTKRPVPPCGGGGQTGPASTGSRASGDEQVGQSGQHGDALPVLRQPPAAQLHIQERMLPLRPHRRLAPLRRLPVSPPCPDADAGRPSAPPASPPPPPGSPRACRPPDSPRRPIPASRPRATERALWPRPIHSPMSSPGCTSSPTVHPRRIPPVVLLRLAHLRVPPTLAVLRRGRHGDEARVHDRPRLQPVPHRSQMRIDLSEQRLT